MKFARKRKDGARVEQEAEKLSADAEEEWDEIAELKREAQQLRGEAKEDRDEAMEEKRDATRLRREAQEPREEEGEEERWEKARLRREAQELREKQKYTFTKPRNSSDEFDNSKKRQKRSGIRQDDWKGGL